MKACLILFILLSNICYAQLNPDSLGMDIDPVLNDVEARYFNISLGQWRGDFNFREKKIGLFEGEGGKRLVTKQDYFIGWGKLHLEKGDFGSNQIIILDEEEKVFSGGYDVIVISWSKKKVDEKIRQKLIKRIKKYKPYIIPNIP